MAITWLKRGKPEAERAADDAQVRATVEGVLADISARGDAAVRDLSVKFDKIRPARLPPDPVRDRGRDPEGRPARHRGHPLSPRPRSAALPKRSAPAMTDVEVETLPGVILGHRNIPVQSVGCYVPGGKFPMVASAHMSVLTAAVAGVPRIIASAPPVNGAPHPAIVAAMHHGRRA
jgi:sulfopropanediol 3-dehydrogenase